MGPGLVDSGLIEWPDSSIDLHSPSSIYWTRSNMWETVAACAQALDENDFGEALAACPEVLDIFDEQMKAICYQQNR